MSWTALVPLKAAGYRKTRLGSCLSAEERTDLGERFARHVAGAIGVSPCISSVIILSEGPLEGSGLRWIQDRRGGLNEELERAVATLCVARVLIVSADLPLLRPDEISVLVRLASAKGAAIAPDRHGMGTNALALASPKGFRFRFGPGSLAAHIAALPTAAIVRRRGLQLDVDTPDDLQLAYDRGVRWS